MVILPIVLDLVHPAKDIITIREIIPRKNEIVPIIRGNIKSAEVIVSGKPSVVTIIN